MIMETALHVGVDGHEYTWIVHHLDVMVARVSLPQNLLIVTDKKEFHVKYIPEGNKAPCYHLSYK